MSQTIIAFLGISGVGKSTLLKVARETIAFQHLEASDLIRLSMEKQSSEGTSKDDLRSLDIDGNQKHLVSGFRQVADPSSGIIVLDGHSVIDTPEALTKVSPSVFTAIQASWLIVLTDHPELIYKRRELDSTRSRPTRTVSDIENYQQSSLLHALSIGLDLDIPVSVFFPTQALQITRLLSALR